MFFVPFTLLVFGYITNKVKNYKIANKYLYMYTDHIPSNKNFSHVTFIKTFPPLFYIISLFIFIFGNPWKHRNICQHIVRILIPQGQGRSDAKGILKSCFSSLTTCQMSHTCRLRNTTKTRYTINNEYIT